MGLKVTTIYSAQSKVLVFFRNKLFCLRQVYNFLRFCELLVKKKSSLTKIILTTGQDEVSGYLHSLHDGCVMKWVYHENKTMFVSHEVNTKTSFQCAVPMWFFYFYFRGLKHKHSKCSNCSRLVSLYETLVWN